MIERSRAELPSRVASLASAPAPSRTRVASIRPSRTANSSGVKPAVDLAETSAPASINFRAAAPWPSAAAHISAVCPRHPSRALTSAPWASSASTAPTTPERAAIIKGVSPSGEGVLGFAPAFRRRSIMVTLPLRQARDSGVTP
jgi:hypothetical protein